MTNQKEIGDILRTNLLAIESIIWLPGCWARISKELEELIEDGYYNELLKAAGIPLKALKRYVKERIDRSEFGEYEIGERDLTGYLVKVGMPVPDDTNLDKDGIPVHGMYTWGWAAWQWFFVQELEEVVELAVAWKQKCCADKHAKNNP
jgi:hypothetical protein